MEEAIINFTLYANTFPEDRPLSFRTANLRSRFLIKLARGTLAIDSFYLPYALRYQVSSSGGGSFSTDYYPFHNCSFYHSDNNF